jgi:hypothetical protein
MMVMTTTIAARGRLGPPEQTRLHVALRSTGAGAEAVDERLPCAPARSGTRQWAAPHLTDDALPLRRVLHSMMRHRSRRLRARRTAAGSTGNGALLQHGSAAPGSRFLNDSQYALQIRLRPRRSCTQSCSRRHSLLDPCSTDAAGNAPTEGRHTVRRRWPLLSSENSFALRRRVGYVGKVPVHPRASVSRSASHDQRPSLVLRALRGLPTFLHFAGRSHRPSSLAPKRLNIAPTNSSSTTKPIARRAVRGHPAPRRKVPPTNCSSAEFLPRRRSVGPR